MFIFNCLYIMTNVKGDMIEKNDRLQFVINKKKLFVMVYHV